MTTPSSQGYVTTPSCQGHVTTPCGQGHMTTPFCQGHVTTPFCQGHTTTPCGQGHPIKHKKNKLVAQTTSHCCKFNMCVVPVFRCQLCDRVFRNYKKKFYRCSNPLCIRRHKKSSCLIDEPCNPSCFSEHCGLVFTNRALCFKHWIHK